MKRHRVLVTVMLAAMALIAGCTSNDETADETTAATPAATVAAPETATTAATTTSTTLSETAAIATVEAFINARNAHDADAIAAFFAEGAWTSGWEPGGTPSWEAMYPFEELVGWQGTLSGCETDDGVVTCLVTSEDTLLSGKAGVVYTFEYEFRFDDRGLIENGQAELLTGYEEYWAFVDAFGLWMMNAYPESFSTFYLVDPDSEAWQERIEQGDFYWRQENWSTPEGVAELSQLIDEFVAQSDVYPLGDAAATAEPVADEPTSKVLFVGNSLSYSNGGVEQHVELLAASADPPLIIQTEEIFRHARLASNWEYVSQRGSIEPGAYDMVVLQSTLRGTTEVASFHEAVRSFAERLREAGAEPVLFMAWPITRYGVDPISVEEIAEAHEDIAAELGVRIAPVGLAWQRAMEERPEIDLYAPDQNHPSLLGTYLAAAVIFGTLFGEDFTDLGYLCQDCVTALHPDGLTEDEARFLQRIARETLQEYDQAVDGSS